MKINIFIWKILEIVFGTLIQWYEKVWQQSVYILVQSKLCVTVGSYYFLKMGHTGVL